MKILGTNTPGMHTSEIYKRVLTIICLLLPVLALANTGNVQNTVELQSVAEKEIVVLNESGKKVRKLVPAATVVPGEEVIYTTSFINTGSQPADSIVITNPVPEHTQYQEGSATGRAADVTFSVDGGKQYGKPDQLKVIGADGKKRTPRAAEYTHIRWMYQADLAPGKKSSVQFRAILQ